MSIAVKFSILRSVLRDALDAVVAVCPAKSMLPVLANVLLEASDDGVRITATDLDLFVRIRVPAEVEQKGAVTLPAKKLVELAKTVRDGTIRFSGDAKAARVAVESGPSRYKLLGLPPDEFPTMPAIDYANDWQPGAGVMSQCAKLVTFAAAEGPHRPVLSGVLLERRAGCLCLVATNGHRLAKADLQSAGADASDVIIPTRALDLVGKLFDEGADLRVASSAGNHLGFRADGMELVTRVIEGPYPNYAQVLPTDNKRVTLVDRDALAAAVRRVGVVASVATRCVRLAFGEKGLRVSASTPDLGTAQDDVDASWEGAPFEIGFNASYLLDLLKHVPTDQVRIAFKAPERAAVFEPVDGSKTIRWLAILMPLRLEAEK